MPSMKVGEVRVTIDLKNADYLGLKLYQVSSKDKKVSFSIKLGKQQVKDLRSVGMKVRPL
jgi:hypothetical protein